MKLKEYLAQENSPTVVAFAARIGVHFTTVYDYMRDDGDVRLKRPRNDTLQRIVTATDGAVGAADFYSATKRAASRRRNRKAV